MVSSAIKVDTVGYNILDKVKKKLIAEGNEHADLCDAIKRMDADLKASKQKPRKQKMPASKNHCVQEGYIN